MRPVSSNFSKRSRLSLASIFNRRFLYGFNLATSSTILANSDTFSFSESAKTVKRSTFFLEMWDWLMNENISSVWSISSLSVFGFRAHSLQIADMIPVPFPGKFFIRSGFSTDSAIMTTSFLFHNLMENDELTGARKGLRAATASPR